MTAMARAWWFLLSALLMCACAKSEDPEPAPPLACPEPDAGVPVDPVLVAFLGKARAAHHRADIFEDQEKPEAAIGTLTTLVDEPSNIPNRPEAHEVLADTHARLADLKSQLGRYDEALQNVEAGMALAKDATYFRGHLFEMQGLVDERRAKTLRAEGDEAAAKRAEAKALDAFEKAMNIQQEVIDKALPEAEPK